MVEPTVVAGSFVYEEGDDLEDDEVRGVAGCACPRSFAVQSAVRGWCSGWPVPWSTLLVVRARRSCFDAQQPRKLAGPSQDGSSGACPPPPPGPASAPSPPGGFPHGQSGQGAVRAAGTRFCRWLGAGDFGQRAAAELQAVAQARGGWLGALLGRMRREHAGIRGLANGERSASCPPESCCLLDQNQRHITHSRLPSLQPGWDETETDERWELVGSAPAAGPDAGPASNGAAGASAAEAGTAAADDEASDIEIVEGTGQDAQTGAGESAPATWLLVLLECSASRNGSGRRLPVLQHVIARFKTRGDHTPPLPAAHPTTPRMQARTNARRMLTRTLTSCPPSSGGGSMGVSPSTQLIIRHGLKRQA